MSAHKPITEAERAVDRLREVHCSKGGSLMSSLSIRVPGEAITQGSKMGFKRGGRVTLVDMSDRKTKTMPANRLKDWKAKVTKEATKAMRTFKLKPELGAVRLVCEFHLERPKSHRLKSGKLRKGAPMVPAKDLDKLVRAVGDSLSGVCYKDDVQIAELDARKMYAESDGFVSVTVVGI